MVAVLNIAEPAQEEINKSPREYALLVQLVKQGKQPVNESVRMMSKGPVVALAL